MLNTVVLVGRLTKTPELRYTTGGKAVATLRLAVDRGGSGDKETDFIDVVVWEKQAETVANYLDKGRLIGVQGRLQIRQYEKDGQKREKAEVVGNTVRFLDRAPDGESGNRTTGGPASFDGEEDVPFSPCR
jgi:single-strand DNA-binding protein